MGQFQLLNARFPVPLSKKTINQTLETVTLVVIIMTFNINSGANVSRSCHLWSAGQFNFLNAHFFVPL